MSYAYPHPGAPPELPELPDGAPPPRRRAPETPWPPWMAPVAFLAAFGVAFVGAAVVALVGAGLTGGDLEDPSPGVVIAGTVFQNAALIGTAVVLARVTPARGPWHFGLRGTRFWRGLGWVAAAYGSFLVLTGIWLAAMSGLGVDVDQENDLPNELGAGDSTLNLVVVGVLVTVVAPIGEELFFRGFFFRALRNWKGVGLATVITGVVFGGIHVGSSPAVFLVPLGIFGALLCLLYWRTGSLLPCIALHAINNSVAFGVSQDYSWQIPLVIVASLTVLTLVLWPFVRAGNREAAGVP